MATSTSALFNGTSTFSADFQTAITRAVGIASLPITQLTSDQTALSSQSSELGAVQSKFTALQTAVQNIGQAVSGSSFNADISDPSVLSATVSDGAMEGNYSVEVHDVGAYSTSLTSSSWVAASGPAQTYTLSVGGQQYNITPKDNSAASVAAAVNSQQGDKIQATVVNVGSNSVPDFRISLQSATLDSNPVDLQLNGSGLQSQQIAGRPAQYEVNGSGLIVTSSLRSATIASGLTVNLLASSSTPTNITVLRSSSALSNALSSFATAYNAAVDEIGAQRGQNGGPLQGQALVFDLSQALGSIGTYSDGNSSGVSGLSDLGLTLGLDGHLTFNQSALLGSDFTNSSGINSFLGSISGGGFLQNVNTILTGITDPTNGSIASTETGIENELTHIGSEITAGQARVTLLQANLTAKMAQSDSLIASMQQQYTYLTGLFQAQQTAAQQAANGN